MYGLDVDLGWGLSLDLGLGFSWGLDLDLDLDLASRGMNNLQFCWQPKFNGIGQVQKNAAADVDAHVDVGFN